VRVIAGVHRGRRLVAPAGRRTRPTSDRVREAVFSLVGDVSGARVLDLFAGSGAMAIEALSRGASAATLVDRAPDALDAARANLRALGVEAELWRGSALAFLQTARRQARQYDLVFLDPPYSQAGALGPRLAPALEPVLASGALVVCECSRREPLELGLETVRERRYGDTLIRIHAARQPNRDLPGHV